MLLDTLLEVRRRSEALIAGLEPEDLGLQGMADASPPKWHLAHTTWFFDTFVLQPHLARPYALAIVRWSYQFNSYYEAVGERHPRSERGVLSRPTIREILEWRAYVDAGLNASAQPTEPTSELRTLVELGLQHEQQHQELLLMDLLDGFSQATPRADLRRSMQTSRHVRTNPNGWLVREASWRSALEDNSFHFDNETPRHRVWLDPFQISDELVSNANYAAFIDDGGYRAVQNSG